MSLSATQDNAFHRPGSGKTPPPPVPSANFSKRTRELQAESAGRYRPPALRSGNSPPTTTLDDPGLIDPAPLPPTNFPAGFRRARAGTLPSNVAAAAQRYASTLTHATPALEVPPSLGALPASHTTTGIVQPRPGLRHATTAGPTGSGERNANSRLRSGSLSTLGAPNLSTTGTSSSSAFPSMFSSSWLSQGTYPVVDELRSIASNDSLQGDDVHTMGYLGLESESKIPAPATVSELRTQAQATIAGRLRATTVSNPYRSRPPLQAMGSSHVEDTLGEEDYNTQPYRSRVDSFDSNSAFYNSNPAFVAKGFKQSQHLGVTNRPRATSVGTLEDPSRAAHRQAVFNDFTGNLLPQPSLQSSSAALLRSLGEPQPQQTRLVNQAQGVRFSTTDVIPPAQPARNVQTPSTFLQPPGLQPQPRSVSPKVEAPQIQTPSRSLWIGNLDSSATKETLLTAFSPYGAIESLRLLPEKECGFVNFLDINDAVRAKDDVLNRLGGNIGGPQPVRIGFGKADSAPAQPAKTNTATPAATATTPNIGGMEVQSTPTRALWIGSIPSSTTPSTILSIFAPFGPIESARVLTHKNCGFINFERLDDAVRARKALNGRDVLGSDVGAIRIGYARVPVKTNNGEGPNAEDSAVSIGVQGVGDLTVGATIHALRAVKGASTIPADQQVLGGAVENYRSNLLLSMIGSGNHPTDGASSKNSGWAPSVTEQQMIMRELSAGSPDAEVDIQALAEFRPPVTYYTSIPTLTERLNTRKWDAARLRELRKKLDANLVTPQEMEDVAHDMMVDGEIVDLSSDWLGNTVVQKLFEKCSVNTRFAMLEHIAPYLATIGIHKNGTWAAQKIIECISTPEEIALVAQNLRPYAPPLLLDQFGNYVVQCCLRFGSPANDFIFDAMIDRLWEVAQGRFGARSMRACLESQHITISQQRRVATAVILNSIPLATNPNGALLLTWLLETSGFPSRFKLLAPRFTPHLSHLCTHKLASLTVLRIINQKIEPEASVAIVRALFNSPGDHVLADVLGDQVNGVSVIHKVLSSTFIDAEEKLTYVEATKRVLLELKASPTQTYRRLMEDVGIPVPPIQQQFAPIPGQTSGALPPRSTGHSGVSTPYGAPSNIQGGYIGLEHDAMYNVIGGMQNLNVNAMGGPQPHSPNMGYGQQGLPSQYGAPPPRRGGPSVNSPGTFSPNSDPFNPFSVQGQPEIHGGTPRNGTPQRRGTAPTTPQLQPQHMSPQVHYGGPPLGGNIIQQGYGNVPQGYQQPPAGAGGGYMYSQPMYQNPQGGNY